jgi:hypothetical protein
LVSFLLSLSIFFNPLADASADLTDGLVLYYSFATNSTPVLDDSGNGHTGTVNGAATWVSNGITGGAYRFDGSSSDDIYLQDVSALHFANTNPFTLCAWLYQTNFISNPYGVPVMGDLRNDGAAGWEWNSENGWAATPRSDAVTLLLNDYLHSGTYTYVTTDHVLTPNRWECVCITYDGSSRADGIHIYLNGNELAKIVIHNDLAGPMQDSVPFRIGRTDGHTNSFKGSIDEVRVYNRALVADELTALYAAGVGPIARLVVAGSPGQCGAPTPQGYGTNLVPLSSVVTNSVTSPVSGGAGVRYVCTGWTGTGDVTNGSGTSVVFTVTTNSTLTWNWRTEYYLDTTSGSHGSIDVGDGWYTNGSVVTITATASNGYHFVSWSGDVPPALLTNNPLTVTMSQARTLAASFVWADGVDLTNGLLLYYSFTTNSTPVSDDSGNGRTGTVHGATWITNGITGAAYSFSGNASDYIECGSVPWGGLSAGTISFWVYLAAGKEMSDWGELVDQTSGGNNRTLVRLSRGGILDFVLQNSYVGPYDITSTSGWDNAWHCLTFTWSGGNGAAYHNGTLLGAEAVGAVSDNSGHGVIGHSMYVGGDYGLNGKIDEFRVYDRALTPEEIVALYSAGVGPVARLVVAGSPAQYGTPSPQGYGTNVVVVGASITNGVASPVAGGVRTQYVCIGWTGTGDITNGAGTNVIFTATTNSTLTWQWRTDYYLDTAAGSHGSVDVGDGWYTNGSVVTITPTASNGYRFATWSGDVPPSLLTNNPLTVTMSQARTLTANFVWAGGVDLTNGLLLYYSFDPNSAPVLDNSGNGHTGIVNGATWTAAGVVGGAYRFNGSSPDDIYLQDTTSMHFANTNPFTLSAWLYQTNFTSSPYGVPVLGAMLNDGGAGWEWGAENGWASTPRSDAVTLILNDYWHSGTHTDVTTDHVLTSNRWEYVCITYDGSSRANGVHFYVNGNEVSKIVIQDNVAGPMQNSVPFRIGRRDGGTSSFKGSLDEVRIYNRVLTPEEVITLYSAGVGPVARLVVAGSPGQYGVPTPQGYGTNLVLVGAVITNRVASPVAVGVRTQYVCTGWTGTGDITNGVGTNVVFTVMTNSTLTWQWRTEYSLDTAAGAHGSVDVGDGWYTNGATVTITAMASNGYRFTGWSGDVSSASRTNNPLTVTMSQARTLAANFMWESGADLTNGLVLYYSFDPNSIPVSDDSGHGHTGTVSGATWVTNGVVGAAYSFDGNNDHISLSPFTLATNATYSAWAKLSNSGGYNYYNTVFGYYYVALGYNGYMLNLDAGDNIVVLGPDAQVMWSWVPNTNWHQYSVVKTGTSFELFVDGVSWGSRTSIAHDITRIGCNPDGTFRMKGMIDEIRIYDRAMTAGEVAALYAASVGPGAQLVVTGSPGQYGTPMPQGYGSHFVAASSVVTNRVASPASGGTGIRYICTGWTGTGDVTNGIGTNVLFTATTNSTLTWQWRTEYYLDAGAGSHGSVNVADGWYTNGAMVTITATASNGYHFASWSGDVSPSSRTNNPVTVTMSQARAIIAVFVSDSGIDEGLEAYYSFENDGGTNVVDDTGHANNGYTMGAVAHVNTDRGRVVRFSSPTTYILSSASSLNMNGWAGGTLSLWLQMKGYTTYGSVIGRGQISEGTVAGGMTFGVGGVYGGHWNGGGAGVWTNAAVALNSPPNLFRQNATPYPSLNRWYHLVFTYDGTQVCFYVDGKLDGAALAAVPGTPIWDDPSTKFMLGTSPCLPFFNWSDEFFNGWVDDVRVYSRGLSSNEVFQLYEEEGGGVTATLIVNGTPARCGSPAPQGYGTNLVFVGSCITNGVASPVSGGTGVRYVCTGWTGTGDITNGLGTNVVFTVTTNSTLTWQWRTDCYLDTAADANGSVDVGDGWYTNGAMVTLTATPSNGYHFSLWSGDVPPASMTNNPLTLTMDQARTVSASFAVTSGVAGIDLTSGLLLYYSFSTNATPVPDDSGNGHTGVVSGATWVTNGICGGGYSFDGSNDNIGVGTPFATVSNPNVTYSTWVKLPTASQHGAFFYDGSNESGNNDGFAFGVGSTTMDNNGNNLILLFNRVQWLNTGVPIGTGWHHVVVVLPSNRKPKAYIDGNHVYTFTGSDVMLNATTGSFVGGTDPSGGLNPRWHKGLLDEVRIYNRALSPDEIVGLYEAGLGGPVTRLVVEGGPDRYGSPAPQGYGTNLVLMSSVVTNGVTSPASGGMGVRYVCTGWTGTGDVTNGTGTTVSFAVTTNSTLTWQWRTEYYLDTTAGAHGSVDVGDGWYTNGAVVTITATASNGYRFVGWSGNVPTSSLTNNPLTVTMDQARTITVEFAWGSQGDINAGLLLYYSFSTNATPVPDDSGNGHTGVVSGAIWVTNGICGGGYSFDGSNDNIGVGTPFATASNSNVTYSVWVSLPSPSQHGAFFYDGNNQNGSNDGFAFGVGSTTMDNNGNNLILLFNRVQWLNTGVPIGTGWHHVVVVLPSNRKPKAYIDGNHVYTFTGSDVMLNATAGSFVGGTDPSGGLNPRWHKGLLDEVRIYNRALAPDEVLALYNLQSGPTARLVVDGNPGRYGTSLPYGYGTNESILVGTKVTNSVASPASGGTGVRYICTGWTGTGDVTNGAGTTVSFTVTTNSTLTWQWRTEYYLDTTAGAHGSVDVGDGWYTNGAIVTITATPDSYCSFTTWSGDVPAGQETVNPLIVAMNQARAITAQFSMPTYTLSGQVFYSGPQVGTIYIEAFTNSSYVNRAAWTQIGSPGSYTLTSLEAGKDYWIRGYLDKNASGILNSLEPVGGYSGNPIYALSTSLSGIDIHLQRLRAPQGVCAKGGVCGIILSWNANSEPGIAGYNVYRFDPEWGVFERLNGAPIVGLSFTDHGVIPDETYYYYVSAVILSEYMSSYMESPASAIVGATAGAIRLWMPDYRGPTGSVVRLRINTSDADGMLAKAMTIGVSYDPTVLTPLSQVDAGRATVEKTVLTQGLTMTNNGLTATGQLQIVATGSLGATNHATLKILGCAYERAANMPIPIVAKYSLNGGGDWTWVHDGKDINKGCSYEVDLGILADGTNCVLDVKETYQGHERRSDNGSAYVKVLRDGDSVLNVPGMWSQEDVQYYLREYLDGNMTLQIGPKDVVYLFELSSATNGAGADYQDVVALVEFDQGSKLVGEGHLFDALFVVDPNKVNGTQASHAFLSADIRDQKGDSVLADISDTAIFTVAANYFLGDINGDGTVNVSGDFTLAMKLAVGQREATALELMAGDIDGDGKITKTDATLIKRIAFGLPINLGGETPPCGSGAGEEPPGASGYELSVGNFEVEPGGYVQVPVVIDNAAGVANIDLRINYDSEVLILAGVTNGALTASFGLEYMVGEGYLDVALASSNSLVSGSGTVANVTFYVPASESLGSMTDITISRHGLGGEFGGELGWTAGIAVRHGWVGVAMTNALSILNFDRDTMEWATRWGKRYKVEWTTNLLEGFLALESNFVGNGTIKSYIDTKSPDRPTKYYRIVGE